MRSYTSLPSLALLLAGMVTVACGDSGAEKFDSDIAPVLEQYCLGGACHGVLPDSEERGEVIDWSFFHVRVGFDGRVIDAQEAYENVKERINTIENAEFSSLLRKPLSPDDGGLVHLGGVQFSNRDHSAYRALKSWIEEESGGGEGAPVDELTANQQQFADEVLPELASRQCMNAACHGPFAPFTGMAAPILIDGVPEFSTEDIKKNYKSMRLHLFLGGDVLQSRLIRKGLPLEAGGIRHRGGNDIFFVGAGASPLDDPAVAAIASWAEAERRAVEPMAATGEVKGIVFVRGPVEAAAPFDQDAFVPGTDLYILEPATAEGTARNLTASAHSQDVDIRDPAVRHDGARIAFAMRTSADDAHNIYEIGVDGTGLVQLTADAAALPGGGVAANVQPTYGPDGRIYFTSTRAGHLADGFDVLDSEIWAVDPATKDLERLTYSPSPEVTPDFIGTGKTYGTLALTMRRTIAGRYEAPTFRMPLDHNKAYHGDPELHIHHGITRNGEILYGQRTMPDARFVVSLISRDNMWRGGQLAIFDRQFGPEVPEGSELDASVGGFRRAFTVVDSGMETGGVSAAGLYRSPAPLPDGRILVTYAPGPLDLNDEGATPELGVYMLAISEVDGPVVEERVALVDEPGVAEFDAEAIVVRPLEDDPSHEPAWDATRQSDTGTIAFRHVETLEALFANIEQIGVKTLRDDLAYARLIEALPVTPDERDATPIGLGDNARPRILGEVELAGGSLFLQVPADVPFRVQFLNRDRMSVGTQQNRWNYVAPGEKFPGGVSPELYPALCSVCHGALSGNPGDVGGPVPDIVTSASLTLATHDNGNPRLPLEPMPVGAGTTIPNDFQADVAPLLARSCAVGGCHDDASSAGGLSLVAAPTASFDTAYERLLQLGSGSGGGRRYVDAAGASAFTSYLIERIYGRELGAPRALGGPGCPGEPALSDEERLVFVRWIDTGAAYRGATP